MLLVQTFIGWLLGRMFDMAWTGLKRLCANMLRHSPLVAVSRNRLNELETKEKSLAVLTKAYDELQLTKSVPSKEMEKVSKWFQ
jgi:uncharacterized protein YjfI (DUF2170 family)